MVLKRYLVQFLVFVIITLSIQPAIVFGESKVLKDIKSTDWYYKSVTELSSRGIIEGDSNGNFNPSNSVTKIEAITMVLRTLGLNSVANNTSQEEIETFLPKVGLTVEDVQPWARGYIVQGIKNGFIQTGGVTFGWNTYANRAWISQLMVRMIGKEGEAINSTNTYKKTDFVDDASIPSWARGYINVAVQYGLINGINVNGKLEFQSNTVANRAVMATLLSRADIYNPNPQTKHKIGYIKDVNDILTIVENNQIKTYSLPSGVNIFEDNTILTVSDLKPYDKIKYFISGDEIVFIDRLEKSSVVVNQVEGTVNQIYLDRQIIIIEDALKTLKTYKWDNSSKVYINNQVSDFTGIKSGDKVIVKYDATSNIIDINIQTSIPEPNSEVQGNIYHIDSTSKLITFELTSGQLITLEYNDSTVVYYKDQRFATVNDLKVGDEVRISSMNSPLVRIALVALSKKGTFEGELISVNPTERVITLRVNGELRPFYVSENAAIQLQGLETPTLSHLEVGDRIKLNVDDQQVLNIEVLNRAYMTEVKGKLRSLDSVNRLLVLENEIGKFDAYSLSEQVGVEINGNASRLSDLVIGSRLKVMIKDEKVFGITLDNRRFGTITEYNTNARVLKLRLEDNTTNTYTLTNQVIVRDSLNNQSSYLDLKVGQDIQVILGVNDIIQEVDVKSSAMYTLSTINETYKRITVKTDSNNQKTFSYDEKTKLNIPNLSNPTWGQLENGVRVKLTFLGVKVIQVDVETNERGTITSIDAQNMKIGFTSFNGKQITLDVTNNTTIQKNSTIISISGIQVGNKAEITYLDDFANIKIGTEAEAVIQYVDEAELKLYVQQGNNFLWIPMVPKVYVHNGNQQILLRDLRINDRVKLTLIAGKAVEVQKVN